MRKRWWLMLALLLLVCMLFTDLQDRRELSELGIILGVGFDQSDTGMLQATIELARRENNNGAFESRVFNAEGKDLDAVADALSRQIDQYLFWGNLGLLVFGQEMPEAAVADLTEELYRSGELGSKVPLLRSQTTAAAIFDAEFGSADFISQGLFEALQQKRLGGKVLTLSDYVEQNLFGGDRYAIPSVMVKEGKVVLGDEVNDK